MNRNNFGDYIDEIGHKCCENKCHKCVNRKGDKELILHWIKRQEHLNRTIQDDLYLFFEVYSNYYPPIEYVREHFKISEKQYERFKKTFYEYVYGKNINAIEDVKEYIIKNKMDLKHTEKYLNKFIKAVYEYNQENNYIKLNYFPEIKLM